MTLKYGPNLGQLIGAAAGDEHYQAILSQWRALDGLVQPAVSSRVSALPTTDLLEGDRYLVTAGTYANRIARYREANSESGQGAGWEYFTPREGWYVWCVADKRGFRFSNGAWAAMDKSEVGLSNVDNTSDTNKPVSTATQSALNAKVDISALEAAGVANPASDYKTISCDSAPAGSTVRFEGSQSDATSLNYPTSSGTASAQVAFSVFTFGVPGDVARLVQIASEVFGSAGTYSSGRGRTFVRVKHDKAWYPWREVVFTASSPTFSGYLTVSRTDAYDTGIDLQGPAGKPRYVIFRTGTSPRFYLGVDGSAEEGSNGGSNFFIDRYNDSGTYQGRPLKISRASGQTTLDRLLIEPSDRTATDSALVVNRTLANSSAVEIPQSLGLNFRDESSANRISAQIFRLTYSRSDQASGGPSSFDALQVLTPVLNKSADYPLRGIVMEGPVMASKTTLKSWVALRVQAPTGDGSVSSKLAIQVEAGAGNSLFGTSSDNGRDLIQVSGSLGVSGPSQVGQYTLSTLPSASAYNGYEIDVTDAEGGAKRCRSDGSNWKILNTTTTVS